MFKIVNTLGSCWELSDPGAAILWSAKHTWTQALSMKWATHLNIDMEYGGNQAAPKKLTKQANYGFLRVRILI